MTPIMQCRDVRELADSFLTGQLLVETNHALVRHLESCPECRADIETRRSLRDRLRRAWSQAEELRARPELSAELVAKLRPAHDALSRRSLLRSWWAVAAGIAGAAGGGLVVRESRARGRLAALARAAAADHQNCAVKFNLAERPISLEEAARRYGAPYAALATFELPVLDAPVEVADRHACVYAGRRFGHLVLRYRGALLSLLVTDGSAPFQAQLQPGDGGPAVAAFRAGLFAGFVVADLEPSQVVQFARTIETPLSRHLS